MHETYLDLQNALQKPKMLFTFKPVQFKISL